MTRRPRTLLVGALALGLALPALAACSSGSGAGSGSRSGSGPSVATAADGRHWRVDGAAKAALDAARPVVEARLQRMGVTAPGLTVTATGFTTAVTVDPLAMEAAGRRTATELWTVTATTVGACPAGAAAGHPSVPEGRRCYQLGTRLADTAGVRSARPQLQPGIGWGVELFVTSERYAGLRAALTPAAGTPVAVVADERVVGVFEPGAALGLHDRIAPGMTQREATRLAYTLLTSDASPVSVAVAEPPAEPGPKANADFWLSALSANVCGAWLADAPATPDASGIHSHGDGFVYAHPSNSAEADDKATLALFLGHGSWQADADRLRLWDGTEHRDGSNCPDGRPGKVRWWVDGIEQHGDPGALHLGNGQAITLSFNPDGFEPGAGPAAARLPHPTLTPEA